MGDRLIYAVRGSTGLFLPRGISKENISNVYEDVKSPKETPCRVFEFSNNGKYFAYCDCSRTVLLEVETGRELLSLPLKRTVAIAFSPRDTYLLLFEPYTVYGQKTEENKPEPNLRVYRTADCSHVTTLVAQKQATWKPQFAEDERIMVRQVGSELLVHKEDALFEKYAFKNSFPKMDNFEISPGSGQYIAIFTPPQGAGTACVQIRRLDPKFTITNTKNFFNGDRAQLIWNSKGTALLIHASVDVDSTNQSYYGASSVHLINVLTGDVCQVSLAKNGPVYAVRWNPNGKEFAVCYGYMPAKVTLFSFRGEPILDMPEGSRNDIHYNAFGNVLLVCGFGNLATGKMEFWDVEKRKEIITIEVPNTTLFQWAPDGRHFLTATTTPRLRIDNNYRLWHYSGKLLHEVTYNSPLEELWQVQFRPVPASAFTEFRVEELTKQQRLQAGLLIKTKHADHPLNNLPAGAIKKVGAYVPPHLRNNANQGALKTGAAPKTVLGETEKKIRNLQKKVDDIVKLKDKQARGEKMELNQVEKISKEAELVAELEALKAS